jgi:hypothetical protein
MTDTTPAPAPAGGGAPLPTIVPAWATDLARSVLMSAGAGLIAKGWVSSVEWPQIVGGLLAAGSAAWSWLARHPSRASLVDTVRGLVAASAPANRATFDGALTAAEAAALAAAVPALNKIIAAHVPGLVRAPVENAADKVARSLGDQAVRHLRV